jgi:hypothetical protein
MNRQNILSDLLTQLATITTDNGYSTDIGDNASYWDVYPDDYSGPASVTVCDRDEDSEKVNRYYNQTLHVEITAIAYTTGANKLADSCNLLADLMKATVQTRWTNYANIVRPVSNSKEIEGKGKQAVCVTLNIDIEYREDALIGW